MQELRAALLEAGRNDLAEELNNKYKEIHKEADKKLRGDDATFSQISSRSWFRIIPALI